VAVAVALALKLLLQPLLEKESPFLIFFFAVMVSAWYGGRGPGFLATALAGLLSDYFFLSPPYSFLNNSFGQNLRLAIFVLEGALISSIIASVHSAKRRAEISLLKLQASEERYRRLIDALRESEQRFRATFNSAAVGIAHVGTNGQWLLVNQKLCDIVGYTQSELLERTFQDITHPEDLDTDLEYVRQMLASEIQTYSIEKRYIRKNGSQVWINLTVSLVREPNALDASQPGEPKYFISIIEDISERSTAEQALPESEKRFRRLVESNIFGVAFGDFSGRITYANDYFLKMVRYEREDLLTGKMRWDQMTPPEFLHLDVRGAEELKIHGVCTPFEKECIRKDGSRVPILIGAALVEPNVQQEIITFSLDLTEHKQVESALRERETRYQLVARATNDAIWDWNLVTQEVEWNEGVHTLFGYWETDVGSDATWWYEHIHPEDRERVVCGIHDVIDSGGQIWSDEHRFLLADNSYALVIDRGFVAHDDLGNPVRMIGSMMDITQRQKAEEEREQLLAREQAARAEAEAANRMKDEFLATLSHELRTPLNAMIGWTQLLRTRKFNEATAARALETIDRNTKSLAQLIEDVLDVSRIITGKLRLNFHPVELVPVIEAALDTVRPAAEAKDIQIESRLDPSAGLVLGDPNRLQQVVWNLLSNAVKFTPKSGRVLVRLELIHSRVQISVSDTGQGISPEFLPYVFDRFRQADSSSTRSHGGLGLGLAIVRHLVELHGGTVHAHSPGIRQGATFFVNLPLMAVAHRASAPEQIQPPVKNEVLTSSLPSLDGLRVLVVDDEADARELLIAALGQYGAEVTAVAAVAEAIEALQRLQPNVLVSDIGMPGEDGYALIRQVRALAAEQGGQIPVVALTAYARAEDRTQAILAGFQLHVPKPVNPAELAAVIANLAGRTGNA
jgi:PAS domain S-box-containing protein